MGNKTFEEEVLEIIEWYGHEVDQQGWGIRERFEAVKEIINLVNIYETNAKKNQATRS